MPITRSQVDPVFLRGYKLSEYLPMIKLDGTTIGESNADVGDFLSQGFASMGKTPSTFGNLLDADLTTADLTNAQARQMIAIAQLAALRTVAAHPRFYDQAVSLGSKRFSQIRDGLNAAIKDLESLLAKLYGYAVPTLDVGTIGLGYDARSPYWDGPDF